MFVYDFCFLGDGVDIRLRFVDIVFVVFDDFGGDVMVFVEVVLRVLFRGCGCVSERYVSVVVVGNEIWCGWDVRELFVVWLEEGMVIIDIGCCC